MTEDQRLDRSKEDDQRQCQRIDMEIVETLALPPDKKTGQQICADLIKCRSVLIFDWQIINDENGVGDPQQEQQQ
jgi:hypothetical protein